MLTSIFSIVCEGCFLFAVKFSFIKVFITFLVINFVDSFTAWSRRNARKLGQNDVVETAHLHFSRRDRGNWAFAWRVYARGVVMCTQREQYEISYRNRATERVGYII